MFPHIMLFVLFSSMFLECSQTATPESISVAATAVAISQKKDQDRAPVLTNPNTKPNQSVQHAELFMPNPLNNFSDTQQPTIQLFAATAARASSTDTSNSSLRGLSRSNFSSQDLRTSAFGTYSNNEDESNEKQAALSNLELHTKRALRRHSAAQRRLFASTVLEQERGFSNSCSSSQKTASGYLTVSATHDKESDSDVEQINHQANTLEALEEAELRLQESLQVQNLTATAAATHSQPVARASENHTRRTANPRTTFVFPPDHEHM